jgi:hypothetical protein
MSGIFDQIINYSPPLIVSGTVNYKGTWDASTNNPTLNSSPAASTKGDYYVVSTAGTQFGITFAIGDWIISNGTAWEKVDLTDAVSSVFGRTGAVVGVSTDYSAVGITNTAIGASNPSTGAFTTVSASTPIAVASGGTGVSTSTGTTNVVLSNSPTIVTPVIAQINDASGNETLKLASIASAVNEISIENAATGNPVHIRATGGDASVGLHLVAKGASGYVNVTDGVDETKRLMFNASGGTTNTRTMLSSTQTVDRTISLPDATGTLLYGGGPLGTPTSGTVTNLTGTASININGTVGATTASTGAFTTLSAITSGSLSQLTLGDTSSGGYSAVKLMAGSGKYNWIVGAQYNVNNALEITPSTATGGSTFSTPVVSILQTGDVGIGTSSPASSNGNVGKILQVASAGNTSSSIIASTAGVGLDNAGIFEVRATAQTSGSDRIGQIYIGRENTSTTALSGYMGFSTPSSGTFAERMRIDSSGNVGIGTTAPTANLTVSGAGSTPALGTYNAVFTVKNTSTTELQFGGLLGSPYTNWIQSAGSGGANAYPLALNPVGGNVGIGTTSPAEKLHVVGGNIAVDSGSRKIGYITDATAANTGYIIPYDGSGFLSIHTNFSSGGIKFHTSTSNTERARIDSSGNLLVGTTSKIAGVDAPIQAYANGGSTILAQQVSITADNLSLWNSASSGNQVFAGFYTDNPSSLRGSITYNRATGLVVYGTTSDYRSKDILGPVVNSGALIDAVPVYMGKMKGATQERPMFIAHETPAYAHTGEKDAVDAEGKPIYQQIDTSALIPVLWAEIQSLRQRVAALESK